MTRLAIGATVRGRWIIKMSQHNILTLQFQRSSIVGTWANTRKLLVGIKNWNYNFTLSPPDFIIYRSGNSYYLTNDSFGLVIVEQKELRNLVKQKLNDSLKIEMKESTSQKEALSNLESYSPPHYQNLNDSQYSHLNSIQHQLQHQNFLQQELHLCQTQALLQLL